MILINLKTGISTAKRARWRARRWYEKNKQRARIGATAWREAHREEHRERGREWKRNNPERTRELARAYAARVRSKAAIYPHLRRKRFGIYIKSQFGLSLADYDLLLLMQSGRCAICISPFKDYREPKVDHRHDTGEVRGLLCHHCNVAIGSLRDDPNIVDLAATYLRRYR